MIHRSKLQNTKASAILPTISPGELVVFIHIPKAAGQTFHSILENNYRPEEMITINGIRSKEYQIFKDMSPITRGKVRCINGHISYGIHLQAGIRRRVTYLTFLRNPVDRVISHYHYVVNRPDHYLHDQLVRNGKVVMSLKEYITECPTEELTNGQTRMLASFDGDDLKGPVGEKDFLRVLDNIERQFSFVGLVELFDLSLVLLKESHGLKTIHYRKQNVGKKRERVEDSEIVEAIERKNEFDMQLYRLFRSAYDVILKDPDLIKQLDEFRRSNERYSTLVDIGKRTKAFIKSILGK